MRSSSLKVCIQFRSFINSSYIVASEVTMLTPSTCILKIGKFVRLYSVVVRTNWHGTINTAIMIRWKRYYMSLLYQFHIVSIVIAIYLSLYIHRLLSLCLLLACFLSFPAPFPLWRFVVYISCKLCIHINTFFLHSWDLQSCFMNWLI
jgi:hypothetical protein